MAKEEKEEKEEKEGKEEGEVKEKKGPPPIVKKILLIAIGVVAVGIIAAVVAKVVATGSKPPEITDELQRKDKIEPPPPPLAIWLLTAGESKITARLADPDEPHICQLAKVFLAHDPKHKKLPMELLSRQVQIEDIFQGVLMNKTSSDLSSEEGKQEFVKELVERVNNVLSKGQIQTIYMEVIVQ